MLTEVHHVWYNFKDISDNFYGLSLMLYYGCRAYLFGFGAVVLAEERRKMTELNVSMCDF